MTKRINVEDKIFLAGHQGLIGSALLDKLRSTGYKNIITLGRKDLDLLDQRAVMDFYRNEKPDMVFVCAAKVGGIAANAELPADFIYENLQIQNNVIWGAHNSNVRRLVFLGSSCIYPRDCPQPIKETYLLTGPLEKTNRPYAIAKIAGLELVDTLRRQYNRDYFSVMPTNLYGPNDNFNPNDSHVLPALIRRIYEAKEANSSSIVVWGTGKPRREFLYSEDCAEAILFLAENYGLESFSDVSNLEPSHINIGAGSDITIRDLVLNICEVVNYKGQIIFDSSKADGTPQKLLDSSRILSLGWSPKTSLYEGITRTLDWYARNKNVLRSGRQ